MREHEAQPFVNIFRPPQFGVAYPCPCCRFKPLTARGSDEICPVCCWEDDGQDNHDADEVRGGPNRDLSLSDGLRNFAAYKACDRRFAALVREPILKEL
jgi:Cysteine-rich CPCC